jgi:hypothetical protein
MEPITEIEILLADYLSCKLLILLVSRSGIEPETY